MPSPTGNPVHLIGLRPGGLFEAAAGLWSVLEQVLPVRFVADATPASCQGWIEGGADPEQMLAPTTSPIPTLNLATVGVRVAPSDLQGVAVTFSDQPETPFPFRGRVLHTLVGGPIRTLTPGRGECILAATDAGPVWTVSGAGSTTRHRSGFALPSLQARENLHDVLNGKRFVELIPLLHFLRGVCNQETLDSATLRACFMFDDPNLHWPSYGHVDYRQIAADAERHHYHVSFATVPLDGWFTHRGTAQLFRNRSRQLSLLVHGNDHTHRELTRDLGEGGRTRLLTQAIRRIERLEAASGVAVSRVMAAPHGACSEEMLALLPPCGFEAATISHGSLRAHNREKPWTRALGFSPVEHIRGCPVLPRWRLAREAEHAVLLAAFLRQAIILVGHHGDLKEGTGVMNELARFINGLGQVHWGSMAEVVHWSCQGRLSGGECTVAPLGRFGRLTIPSEARRLWLHAPAARRWKSWQVAADGQPIAVRPPHEPVELNGLSGREIVIELTPERDPDPRCEVSTRPGVLPLSRRLLTELRDRLVGLR